MADRYWVRLTGNNAWRIGLTTTADWSTTSGGAPGASVPTSADNVFFDSNSGNRLIGVGEYFGNYPTCNNLTITSGYAGQLASYGTNDLLVHGTLNIGKYCGIRPVFNSGSVQSFIPNGYAIPSLSCSTGTTINCTAAVTIDEALYCTQSGQITFVAGTTNTIASVVTGAPFAFRTTVSGTQSNISDSSGENILNYIDSKDINYTGGAAWLKGTAFIDSGNNTGLSSGTASYSLFFGSIA